jgi:hypothetical protein
MHRPPEQGVREGAKDDCRHEARAGVEPAEQHGLEQAVDERCYDHHAARLSPPAEQQVAPPIPDCQGRRRERLQQEAEGHGPVRPREQAADDAELIVRLVRLPE